MTYTQYIGQANVRTVKAADWSALLITAGDTTWNAANSWSVDESTLSMSQLAWLATQSEFLTGQPTVRAGGSSTPSTAHVTQAQLTSMAASLIPGAFSRLFAVGHSGMAGGGAPGEEQAWHNLLGGLLRAEVINYAKGGAVCGWGESDQLPYGTTGDGGVGHVLHHMPKPALYRQYGRGGALAYAAGTTYAYSDIVVTGAAPYRWWQSMVDQNVGHDPTTDGGANWQEILGSNDRGHPWEPRGQLPIVFFGNNDLGWVGDLKPFLNSLRAVLSMVLAAEVTARGVDPRCTYSGGFGGLIAGGLGAGSGISSGVANGARAWNSSTADVETIAIPADWPGGYVSATYVTIGKSTGGVVRIQVDGSTVLTKDFSTDPVGSAILTKTSAWALRFPVPAGAHTVTIQQTTATAGFTLAYTDGLIMEASPAPPVIVPGLFKYLSAASYAALYGGGTAMTDGTIDAWNTAIKAMLAAEFPSAVYRDLAITRDPTIFSPDGIHPNALGQANIAADLFAFITGTLAPGLTPQMRASLSRSLRTGRATRLVFGDDFATGAFSVTVAEGWKELSYVPAKVGYTNPGNLPRIVEISMSAEPGDMFELELTGLWANNAGATSYIDIVTVNWPNGRTQPSSWVNYVSSGGATQAQFGLNDGVAGNAGIFAPLLPSSVMYEVKPEDLNLGQVTFRVIAKALGATRGIYCSVDNRIQFDAKPIGQRQFYYGALQAR